MSILNEYVEYLDCWVLEITQDDKFYEVLFDKDDFDIVYSKSWRISSEGYAVYYDSRALKSMHRLFLGEECPDGYVIDHINRNRLDNTRENLRVCTYAQNSQNAYHKPGRSGYNGVHYNKKKKLWDAYIFVNTKRINLGFFDTKQQAIKARLQAEKDYWGDYGIKR